MCRYGQVRLLSRFTLSSRLNRSKGCEIRHA
jgi:hypothetical protein